MLKRAWLLFSTLWAVVGIWAGSTRIHGLKDGDYALALAPFVLGWLLALGTRFVVTGSPLRSRGAVPYRRP